MKKIYIIFVLLFLAGGGGELYAQKNNEVFGAINENQLAGTYWQYESTEHVESNTVLHQADRTYRHFIHLKYDNQFEQYQNGDRSNGVWSVNDRTLDLPIRDKKAYEIALLNNDILVLSYEQKRRPGTFQYRFNRVKEKKTPFIKPANELPDVLVEEKKSKKNRWLLFKKKTKKSKYELARQEPYINIELVGGGYYGGIDPVLKDIIHIKNDGRLIKEFQSKNNGLIVTKKNIDREELESFAEYISKQDFFNLDRLYDCETPACLKRKKMEPRPIPLRLSIVYGNRKKHITIGVWGKDKYGVQYIDYPDAIDRIIDAIQRMANRLEEPVVRNR